MLYPDFHELVRMGSKPNRLELASNRPTLAAASGNYASPFRGQGLTFHEVRDYRAGDDIRNIDWRVTARMNKPYMKVFTEDRERTVMLCVDANVAMRFGTRSTFKSIQAARAAALIGRLANGSHDRVGCVVFGDVPEGLQFFRPARSRRALWQALQLLSRPKTGDHKEAVPLETALQNINPIAPTGSLIFIISDFYSIGESLEKNLTNLRHRADIILVRIDDPADGLIPPIGSVWFSDENDQAVAIDTDSRAGQEAYARQWQDSRARLENICLRCGINIIGLHTDRDVHDDLVPALRYLGQARRR
jgi:uncharacterized protein (DUF58 family)